MKRIVNTATLAVAALVFLGLAARDAGAIELTLNFVQSQSRAAIGGNFGGISFSPQDVDPPGPGGAIPGGISDFDPANPSTSTSFQGTITVDVDNVNSPTSIRILGSALDADLSGSWLAEVQPFLDRNGDNSFGEFGLPPDGDSCPSGGAQPAECTPGDTTPGPGANADWGVRNIHPSFGVDVAYAAVRDLVFNITQPAAVPVVGGDFASTTENFEFATGWLDYFVAPAAGNLRGRAELAGGDDDNQTALPSNYTVTALPGNQREIKLTIPLSITDAGDDATFTYNGSFVATLTVPEPATFVLSGLAMAFVSAFAARRRK